MVAEFKRGQSVTRPTPERLTSTLLDHATVVDVPEGTGFGYQNNTGMWPSYNCLDLLVPTPLCPNPMTGSKDFKFASWVGATEFAVYGGVQCRAIGLDIEDQKRETKRVFEASESKGVEQHLLYNRFAGASEEPGSDEPLNPAVSQWDAPDDLTPTAGVGPLVALALLEGDAASKYVGIPTIHMPRALATMLEAAGAIKWEGEKAFTKNGSKVAMGGGYDDPEMLASGQWTMYATGEVYVQRSVEIEQNVYQIPGDGSGEGSDQNGIRENSHLVLMERMFRVALDCYTAKVTATVFEVGR